MPAALRAERFREDVRQLGLDDEVAGAATGKRRSGGWPGFAGGIDDVRCSLDDRLSGFLDLLRDAASRGCRRSELDSALDDLATAISTQFEGEEVLDRVAHAADGEGDRRSVGRERPSLKITS
jgi:hypothetical protein